MRRFSHRSNRGICCRTHVVMSIYAGCIGECISAYRCTNGCMDEACAAEMNDSSLAGTLEARSASGTSNRIRAEKCSQSSCTSVGKRRPISRW